MGVESEELEGTGDKKLSRRADESELFRVPSPAELVTIELPGACGRARVCGPVNAEEDAILPFGSDGLASRESGV